LKNKFKNYLPISLYDQLAHQISEIQKKLFMVFYPVKNWLWMWI